MIHIGLRQVTNMQRIVSVLVLVACFSLLLSCQVPSDSQGSGRGAYDGGAAIGAGADIVSAAPDADQKSGEARKSQAKGVDQLVGGWRLIRSESDYENRYMFAMLPSVPAPGNRFVAYDLIANRVVCCAVVEGDELSEDYLINTLHIPLVRVFDLMNSWNFDEAPYRPRVVELQMVGALKSYEFLDGKREYDGVLETFYGFFGGLLLPESTEVVGPAELRIDGRSYAVSWSGHSLADGDGVVETYMLKSDDGEALSVEVPYGTN